MATLDPTGFIGGVAGLLVNAGAQLVEDVVFAEKRGAELKSICLDDLRPLLHGILQSSSSLKQEQRDMLTTFKNQIDNVSCRIERNRESRSYRPWTRYVWSMEIKDAERRIQAFTTKAVALCTLLQLQLIDAVSNMSAEQKTILEKLLQQGQQLFSKVDEVSSAQQIASLEKLFQQGQQLISSLIAQQNASLNDLLLQNQQLISTQSSSFGILTDQMRSYFRSILQPMVAPTSKQLFGRETDIAHLKRLLLEDDHRQMIQVTGPPGIGKSFLVQCVCSLREIRQHFEGNVFLVDLDNGASQQQVLSALEQQSCGRPWLVLLDGARDDNLSFDPSEQLRRNSKSRVVVTSWNRNMLTGIVEELMRLGLGSLGWKDSYRLFCWHAFQNHEAPPSLEQLARRLASLCEGVPLALKMTGKAMKLKKDPEKWERTVCRVARGGPSVEVRTRKLFKLSYGQLSWKQNRCFLILAALEGHNAHSDFILHAWRAVGLVEDEYDADGVRSDLIDTSLVVEGFSGSVKLPATVLPLAWDAIKAENLPYTRTLEALMSSSEVACIQIDNLVDHHDEASLSSLKLLVLTSWTEDDMVINTRDARHLRLLSVFSTSAFRQSIKIQELNKDLVFLELGAGNVICLEDFEQGEFWMPNLEVLSLVGRDIQFGSHSVSKFMFRNLPKLRRLCLQVHGGEPFHGRGIHLINCVELRELEASGVSLNNEAVKALGSLVNLEKLHLNYCGWPALVDLSFLGNMPRLETLQLYGRTVVAVSASCIFKCIGLRELHIPMVQSDINDFLTTSSINDFQQLLTPFSKLASAKLGRIGYPNNSKADEATQAIIRCSSISNPLPPLISSLEVELPLKTLPLLMAFTRLKYLRLGGCGIMLHLGSVDHPLDLYYLPSLQFLDLWNFATKRISKSFIGAATIGRLERLKLSEFPKLVELRMPSAPHQVGSLEIRRCHKLKNMGEWGLMKELTIMSCNRIKQLPISIAGLSSLERLMISDCSEFDQVLPQGCAGFPNLRHVTLTLLESLHHIPDFATHFPALCTLGGTLELDSPSQLDGVNLEDRPGFAKLSLTFRSSFPPLQHQQQEEEAFACDDGARVPGIRFVRKGDGCQTNLSPLDLQ